MAWPWNCFRFPCASYSWGNFRRGITKVRSEERKILNPGPISISAGWFWWLILIFKKPCWVGKLERKVQMKSKYHPDYQHINIICEQREDSRGCRFEPCVRCPLDLWCSFWQWREGLLWQHFPCLLMGWKKPRSAVDGFCHLETPYCYYLKEAKMHIIKQPGKKLTHLLQKNNVLKNP